MNSDPDKTIAQRPPERPVTFRFERVKGGEEIVPIYASALPSAPLEKLRMLLSITTRLASQLDGQVPREVAVGGAAAHILQTRLYREVCRRWDRFCLANWRRDSSTLRLWRAAFDVYCQVMPASQRPLHYSQLLALRGVAHERILPVWLTALKRTQVQEITARQIRTIALECGALREEPRKPDRANQTSHFVSVAAIETKEGLLADVHQAELCCRRIVSAAERSAQNDILQEAKRLLEYFQRQVRLLEIETAESKEV